MGRYYTGDIEGKFAFGEQASDTADQFGVQGQPQYLEYYFSTNNISEVRARLTELEESFGEYKTPILTYIDLFGCEPYEQVIPLSTYLERAGMKLLEGKKLSNYFDYSLGRQILQCIGEKGECSFSAEL